MCNHCTITSAGNALIIKNGVPVMKDGSSLKKYLKSKGFKEGQEINIADHQALLNTIALVDTYKTPYQWSA